MGLDKYHEKRDFERTPEPEGKIEPSSTGKLYIIQKHAASRLHYDLRLELHGVLKSWAVPKGPSLDPNEKRLAVHVEDHPIEYGSFEGTIPKGEYDGGTVMLWDHGRWEPIGDPREGYGKGDFKFRLYGEKLKGAWVLAKMKGRAGEEDKNWLLIKKRDEYAISTDKSDPLVEMDRSVASGRSMQEIAALGEKVWFEGEAVSGDDPRVEAAQEAKKTKRKKVLRARIDPSELQDARPGPQPKLFRPQLTALVDRPPSGDNWIHEIKYDGYRIICTLSGGSVSLVSRNANDWTPKFPEIAESASKIPVQSAILDGEIVVLDPEGRTDFQALQNILKGTQSGRLFYYIFDIPHAMGFDLTQTPLLARKELLRGLLESLPESSSRIRYADHIRGNGEAVFSNACRLGLEGIVSKQADSPYEQKRSRRWLKVKCFRRQEFVIGGFTDPGGLRTGFGALLLGYYDPQGELIYSGRAGTGFDEKDLKQITPRLAAIEMDEPPFKDPPDGYEARTVHWVSPELVAEVEFTSWTREGVLRHPSFKGLRADKDPREVVKETPDPLPLMAVRSKAEGETGMASTTMASGGASLKTKSAKRSSTLNGDKKTQEFNLSNPNRVLYPEIGVTKLQLAEYYTEIAERMLPHILRRPLTLVRCPEGWQKDCFYQKHLGEAVSGPLRSIPIREKDGTTNYSLVESAEGLVSLVQIGALEIHVWGSREENIEKPDMMVFDLDPDPEVAWEKMARAAFVVRERLSELGLASFLKTTGGKGLHVVVPLTPRRSWDEVKEFSRALAGSIVDESPHEFIATMSKAKRKGKIFIDYLRNGRGATSVCAYSTRARSGAPISTPIAWEELFSATRPDSFNIENIRHRLTSLKKDPWEGYFKVRQSITEKMKKQVGLSGAGTGL